MYGPGLGDETLRTREFVAATARDIERRPPEQETPEEIEEEMIDANNERVDAAMQEEQRYINNNLDKEDREG